MKIFRFARYLVLFTLVLNLGDWPFVDEILAQYMLQQETTFQGTHTASIDKLAVQSDKVVSNIAAPGSIFYSLTDLLDYPRHDMTVPPEARRHADSQQKLSFTSACHPPLERPPALA